MNKFKIALSIAFLSAAIIAYQLALIQILSISQWYHFAYMVISIALLGFGAAGSVLAIFQKYLTHRTELLLPFLMTGTGITLCLVTDVSQLPLIRFDSYLLFAEYGHIGKLLLTYLLFFFPFFFAALAIGLVFVRNVGTIGKIYFANLLGSGAGGLVALLLIGLFFPNQLPALIAIMPVLAGLFVIPKHRRLLHIGFVLVAAGAIVWKLMYPPDLILSEYKDLSKTLLLPDAKIRLEKTSPYGIVQVVSSPALRYAPGMSLTAQKTAQVKMVAFINGDWFGVVTDWKKADTSMVLDYTTSALPYRMAKRNNVLVLQSGTGTDVAHALTRKAKNVVAVEANAVILSTLQNQFVSETDSLLDHPDVSTHNLEPRTFLLMDTAHFDLIVLPIVGTFGGSSGLHALHEQFILTKEAFREMWSKLNRGGVISVTSWMDYPVRNPLKILATMVEVLRESGIQNPTDNIVAIRSWATITFVMTKTSLKEIEIKSIRRFCEEMMFDPAILPELSPEERNRYNQFQDDLFFDYVDKITSSKKEAFYEDYDFNVKPASDNKPYFSQYIKWSNLKRLAQSFGNRSIPFFEIGYLLVIITLIQISIASFILILLPLFKVRWKGKGKFAIILYFGGIGLGYMFVEMVFIQRFILYFGNPVFAASAVITSLLIFSGLGSYYSNYFTLYKKRMLTIFVFIVLILLTYSFLLTPVLQQTVDANLFLKLLNVFLITGPLAFCMGIPFPAGLSQISKMSSSWISWAWGINGCVSVMSTALATVVAVEMGFTWVMLFAAIAYCLPLFVEANLKRLADNS
ncbi:MAG TPA: class I SAM-dependent methyltransferase [Cyclobacteriaceae bacterium]